MAARSEGPGELERTFEYNDADGDGKIEFHEFVNMLRDLDARVAADEARIGFDEIDADSDGVIDLDEFVDWWQDG
jgi:Ca2+-binding EF-hand superfamily protein